MMATMEIGGFIDHFKRVASAGHEAKLNMETKLGEIGFLLTATLEELFQLCLPRC